jgi:hypothetical protein
VVQAAVEAAGGTADTHSRGAVEVDDRKREAERTMKFHVRAIDVAIYAEEIEIKSIKMNGIPEQLAKDLAKSMAINEFGVKLESALEGTGLKMGLKHTVYKVTPR